MKGVREFKILGEPFLGSIQTIQVVFDEAPTSARIRIRDPFGILRVEDSAMVSDSGSIYYYYDYQNTDVNNFGRYEVIVRGNFGSNKSYEKFYFDLFDPDIYTIGGF